jgi:hypothetical protein
MWKSPKRNCRVKVGASIVGLVFLLKSTIGFAQSQGTQPVQRGQGQRASSAKPPSPMTLRQVIESLTSLRNSVRVESLIGKAGVQFQATPEVVDVLKQFGASPRLISMIPVPPPPPQPPPPKTAGPLTIMCEPKDCNVIVDERYEGTTNQNRKIVTGLRPGTVTVQIFAEGYEHLSRQIALQENKPAEENFSLKRSTILREEGAKASLLKTLSTLGRLHGLVALSDIEGNATMESTNSDGGTEVWAMSFNKHPGKNLVNTFKSKDGQCVASVVGQTSKQDCKGGLKNGGEKIASQGTLLFLSYQVQDVLQTLLGRQIIASEADDNRVESIEAKDSYVLTIGNDGFPKDLVYQIGNTDPIHVEYSGFFKADQGWYPKRISLGRVNSTPTWVFTITSVRSRVQFQ